MKKLAVLCGLIFGGIVSGQRGTGDWMTSGSDAQRSAWVRNDAKISPESMAQPGFQLVWKLKLENQPRQLNSLTPPALLDFYIGYRGFRTLAFFGASSGKVVAVDTDLGRIEWEKVYTAEQEPPGTPACPGGMTSPVTRPTSAAYPPPPLGRGAGRGTPAKSGVGAPHEGSVVLTALASRPRPVPPPASATRRPARAAEPSPFAPHVQAALALTADGKLHTMWVSNGNEPDPGLDFVPAGAQAVGLIAYGNKAYVATLGDCGGAGNGLWSLDLATKKVGHWKSNQEIAGTAGPAVGPDGTLYIAAGNDLVALSPGQLETLAVYKNSSGFSSSPVVFEFQGKNLLAIASNNGRLNLLDTAVLNDNKPLDGALLSDSGSPAGALASWQDPSGTRWILAPASRSIVAYQVVDRNGRPALEPGWTSREILSPLPPIIVNGVVFAVSSGEFRTSDTSMAATERARKSTRAVLYALDGRSGKELWMSGNVIESFVHSGGLAAGGTRVYVSTYEGMQYAFGFPIEH